MRMSVLATALETICNAEKRVSVRWFSVLPRRLSSTGYAATFNMVRHYLLIQAQVKIEVQQQAVRKGGSLLESKGQQSTYR